MIYGRFKPCCSSYAVSLAQFCRETLQLLQTSRQENGRERHYYPRDKGKNVYREDTHVVDVSIHSCGMRVAPSVSCRVAPRADARRGSRKPNNQIWRTESSSTRPHHSWTTTTRGPQLGARVPPPATQPWAQPPRRVKATAKRYDDAGGKETSRKSIPLTSSLQTLDGDFFYQEADDFLERSVFAKTPSLSIHANKNSTPPDPLKYEQRCLAPKNTGSVLGAIALITGSTVGAGVLALPETVSPAGIGPSSVVLFGCWGLLVCEALLLAEVNVSLMRERDEYRLVHGRGHSPVAISLSEMAGRTLGKEGAACVTFTYLFLSCTLLTAYVSKSGAIISNVADGLGGEFPHIDPGFASIVFTVVMGGSLATGGVKLADSMNQVLTLTLLSLFAVLIGGGAQAVDWGGLDFTGDWTYAPQCVPVVFLALVYHDLIPVICSYLAGDSKKIRKAVVLGSTVPLTMFLIWDAVALGVQAGTGGNTNSDPLTALMTYGDGAVALVVGGFSFCAIATSFIGTAIGVSEFAQPKLEKWAEDLKVDEAIANQLTAKASTASWEDEKLVIRSLTYLLMLAIPATVAVTKPDVFLPATNFAGAYGMTAMFGILPPVMAFKMRRQLAERATLEATAVAKQAVTCNVASNVAKNVSSENPWTFTQGTHNVGGGTPALIGLSFAACAITVGQLRNDIAGGASRGGVSNSVSESVSVASDTIDATAFSNPTDGFDALVSLSVPNEVISATAAIAGGTWEALEAARNALFHT